MLAPDKMKKDQNNYYEAFKKAIQSAWKYKFLWFWGIFLPTGFSLNFNFSNHSENQDKNNFFDFKENFPQNYLEKNFEQTTIFLSKHIFTIFLIIGLLIILFIILWILSAIVRGGITNFLNHSQNLPPEKLEKINFKKNFLNVWNNGKRSLADILKLDLIFYLTNLALFFIMLLPIGLAILSQNEKAIISISMIALIIFIPIVILFVLIRNIGSILIILAKIKTFQAIEHGYYLIIKNLKELIKLLLSLIVFGFLATFTASAIFIILIIMFVGLLTFLFLTLKINITQFFQANPFLFLQNLESEQKIGLLIVLIIFFLVLLLLLLWLKSLLGIIKYDVWIWWIKKVGGVKIKEKKLMEKNEIIEEKAIDAITELKKQNQNFIDKLNF